MYMAAPLAQFTPIDGSPALADWKNVPSSCVAGAAELTNVGAPYPKAAGAVAAVTEVANSTLAPPLVATGRRAETASWREGRMGGLLLGRKCWAKRTKACRCDQGRCAAARTLAPDHT